MTRRLWTRSAAFALLALLTTAAAGTAADLLLEGSGTVNQGFVAVGPNTLAYTVSLKGTLGVGDEVFHFNKSVANVVQIFPPSDTTSSFWNDATLDLGQGDTLCGSLATFVTVLLQGGAVTTMADSRLGRLEYGPEDNRCGLRNGTARRIVIGGPS
jgi:hypothetical protein